MNTLLKEAKENHRPLTDEEFKKMMSLVKKLPKRRKPDVWTAEEIEFYRTMMREDG